MPKKRQSCKEKKFRKVMKEFGRGKLKSGSGKKVTKLKQAQAIAFSESRQNCNK